MADMTAYLILYSIALAATFLAGNLPVNILLAFAGGTSSITVDSSTGLGCIKNPYWYFRYRFHAFSPPLGLPFGSPTI